MADELTLIKTGPISYDAYLLPDQDKSRSIKTGRIIKIKSTGIQSQSSIEQLNLYWAACHFTATQTDDENLLDKYKVDSHCRVALKFFNIDTCVYDGNKIYFELMSLSLKNLKTAIKNNYFNNAFELMALKVDVSVDTFIKEVQSKMLDKHGKYSNGK